MAQQQVKQGLTAAERKRLQRARDKAVGYVEISVRVPADRVEEVRSWCAQLTPKSRPRDVSQMDMFKGVAE